MPLNRRVDGIFKTTEPQRIGNTVWGMLPVVKLRDFTMADDGLQFQFKKVEPSKMARKVQTFQTRGIYNHILVVCGVDPVLGHFMVSAWFQPDFAMQRAENQILAKYA